MRLICTLCLLLFFISCFSQINDRIILADYEVKNDLARQNNISLCRMGSILISDKNLSGIQESIIARDTLNNILASKISGVSILPVQKKTSDNTVSIRIRCGLNVTNNYPLYIIDGITIEEKIVLPTLKAEDIESISILKGVAAAALYGCHATNGVIIITTKAAHQRKFIIKDFLDGTIIPGATVSFISADKRDTMITAANDSGIVETNKLKNAAGYTISVTAVGYKTLNEFYKINYNKEQVLLLNRSPRVCAEVILSATVNYRTIRCGYGVVYITNKGLVQVLPDAKTQIKIYPNPVKKGTDFKIDFNGQTDVVFRITSFDGKQILEKSFQNIDGKTLYTLQTDPRWAAGIYFVQLYANGKLFASDKLVIQ